LASSAGITVFKPSFPPNNCIIITMLSLLLKLAPIAVEGEEASKGIPPRMVGAAAVAIADFFKKDLLFIGILS